MGVGDGEKASIMFFVTPGGITDFGETAPLFRIWGDINGIRMNKVKEIPKDNFSALRGNWQEQEQHIERVMTFETEIFFQICNRRRLV